MFVSLELARTRAVVRSHFGVHIFSKMYAVFLVFSLVSPRPLQIFSGSSFGCLSVRWARIRFRSDVLVFQGFGVCRIQLRFG
jgi:hypothetical protein